MLGGGGAGIGWAAQGACTAETMLWRGSGRGLGELHAMEVLASIPELAPVGACTTGQECPSGQERDGGQASETGREIVRRSPSVRFPSPSVLTLMVVAAAFWVAAWRNDQLRWEASHPPRPPRLAMELPATAGAPRTLTP